MIRLRALCATALTLAALAAGPRATAQQMGDGVAIAVNDRPITVLEIQNRTWLNLVAAGQDPDRVPRDQAGAMQVAAARQLITEALQLEEAKRLGITVTDAEIDQAIRDIAQRNSIPVEQLIRNASLRDQVRAQLGWRRVVEREGSREIQVSEEEIRQYRERLRLNAGRPEFLAYEILLPIEGEGPQAEARALAQANDLVGALRNGASFAEMARQYSIAPGAADGGSLDWLQWVQLDEDMRQVLDSLQPGQIATPRVTSGGVQILALRERRESGVADPNGDTITLRLIALPEARVGELSSLTVRLQARTPVDCAQLDAITAELDIPTAAEPRTDPVRALPPPVAEVVRTASVGDVRAIPPNALVVVCERDASESGLPSRDEIFRILANQKLLAVQARMLRELQRGALVRNLMAGGGAAGEAVPQ